MLPVLPAALLTAPKGRALVRNLFDRTHAGFGGADRVAAPTPFPRSSHVQLTWRY